MISAQPSATSECEDRRVARKLRHHLVGSRLLHLQWVVFAPGRLETYAAKIAAGCLTLNDVAEVSRWYTCNRMSGRCSEWSVKF
jgi:hypothetical protein